ncbi:DUF4174 domain-containing protein [Zeaxanthinibacter sp. PT1]|uniref:DUF4174 domain-containing protein n=1 Tax=Zeaxanthinibacter TaxID=561554 RepID=UPI00234A4EAB|nr:DUF4174 domain-containing protein [Zeaxanthinibacter sp. PT1]MDC6351788.1 DUF4174 domain-containing protein [Zeaxanthinibacter sp. PT1]
MRTLLVFGLLLLSMHTQAQHIGNYRWKYRLLFLSVTEDGPLTASTAASLYKLETDAIAERDLLVFYIREQHVYDANGEKYELEIPENYYPMPGGTVLVGKDGGVKLKRKTITDPATIFTLIDGMPMRRAEMKRKKPD